MPRRLQKRPTTSPSPSPPESLPVASARPRHLQKRPRLSPDVSESSAARDANASERLASSSRVLAAWDDIARKYGGVAAADDDVIDLRTLAMVKDRGMLRGKLTQTLHIGDFADPRGIENDHNAEERDIDEIVQHRAMAARVPAKETSDADDLRAFLDAEADAQQGDESSDDDIEEAAWRYMTGKVGGKQRTAVGTSEEGGDVEIGSVSSETEVEDLLAHADD